MDIDEHGNMVQKGIFKIKRYNTNGAGWHR